jgi:Arc/MetJ-type ribon-helix-helix transcriptional regulator
MSVQENPKIQKAIDIHMATGRYSSAEEVVLVALAHLAHDELEFDSTVREMQESIADQNAGRIKPAETVFADVQAKHGFSEPE